VTNLIYTLLQIAHNFGAAVVVGGPACAYWLGRDNYALQRRMAWLVVFGAAAQLASGIGFGLASQFIKGELPELEGVALIALIIKIICVTASLALMLRYLFSATTTEPRRRARVWLVTFVLGSSALAAAACLRWYL
jgi:hypothetical protein